jgi:isocitrate/isopropylmalate dehydrogenase
VALELQSLHAGALPVAAHSLLERISEAARQNNVDVTWYRHEGHPVALLRFQADQDRPTVKLEHLYVDNAAMQLVLAPAQFDVILTSNMFGDILSDLGAALAGSIGLIPSMSLGPGPFLYEPIHGSAPTLAGKDVANPVGMILSATMMLRESFGLTKEAEWIESAVDRLFANGIRTPDTVEPGTTKVGCIEFGDRLCAEMAAASKQQRTGA